MDCSEKPLLPTLKCFIFFTSDYLQNCVKLQTYAKKKHLTFLSTTMNILELQFLPLSCVFRFLGIHFVFSYKSEGVVEVSDFYCPIFLEKYCLHGLAVTFRTTSIAGSVGRAEDCRLC